MIKKELLLMNIPNSRIPYFLGMHITIEPIKGSTTPPPPPFPTVVSSEEVTLIDFLTVV